MIAIPVSGEVVRRTLRTLVVAAITIVALGISLPNLVTATNPLGLGDPDFGTVNNVVVWTEKRAEAAGISVGDRIDYARMPLNQRYGLPEDGLPRPIAGKTLSFAVNRHGNEHIAVLTPRGSNHWLVDAGWTANASALLELTAEKAAFLVVVLLAAALVLMRPTRLTAAFFLFVAGTGGTTLADMPYHCCSVLGPLGYAVVMALDDMLAGLGVIGFLMLAVYLDPNRLRISSQLLAVATAVLFTVIVLPIAISDVLEIAQGARPAWPVAGWASFLALWFCYVAGFFLLLRLTGSGTAPRAVRALAAVIAAIGALTVLNWALSAWETIDQSGWYFANLPGVVMNRNVVYDIPTLAKLPNWQLEAWHIAVRVAAALAIVYATVRGNLIVARSKSFRVVSYAVLTIALVAILLLVGREQFIARLLGSLLAFYVIIGAGIADTGPVLRRVVVYIVVAMLIVAAFVFANIALVPQLAGYPLIYPIEILVAVAIGYWVSGLRDLSSCLSLACVDGWSAWARGHPLEERDALAQSLGLAERSRQPGIIAEVRAQAAFSAWRDGNDGEFQRNIEALQRALAGRNMRGLRGFAEAATADRNELRFAVDDLPEWKSRAALVLCARTNDARRAQQLATDALASADSAGLYSLQVLGSIAVAETRPEQRNASLENAHAIARDAGWSALSKSILALRANARDIGILQSFVDSRLRKSRPARPMFEVSFFNAELCQDALRVSLSEKELELLLTVASARTGINDADVIDAIWPESDGDAARTAFRVCLHRLRKSVGDARIVSRVGKGYVVHPWADVDLWRLQSLISTCRASGGLDGTPELRRLCDALRAGKGRRATLGEWFYRFEQMLQRKLDEAERILGREAAGGAKT